MKVIKILPEQFASNTYILTADGKTAVVIDPSEKRVSEILGEQGLNCEYVLLTHGHFDHVGGCGVLFDSGAKICCGGGEKDYIFSSTNLTLFPASPIPKFEIYRTFSDGENFELCGIKFTALFTAGHTAGSVCYITEDCIFSGDTLFRRSVGRSDLPTGDGGKLIESVKRLFSLEGDYKVYCGHEGDTTLSEERKYNPFVR